MKLIIKPVLLSIVFVIMGLVHTKAQRMLQIVFQPSYESFKNYQVPEWFRDAKFGIWAHWGPQAVARKGDWYAKKIYQQGSPDYLFHLEHFGHPSKFGYKDIIPLWKAEKWDPEYLMTLYKKAGAKYFVSMGAHHDNFFLWNSKIHKWNAVQIGPQKDIVGIWQKIAKKHGLRFGVSEHLAASYTWFQTSHGADTAGPYKGIPYDGSNADYAELYHTKAQPDDKGWLTKEISWQKEWLRDLEELIDNYHPDLLYSDSKLPFDSIGNQMLAHYYNDNIKHHKGKLEAVYNCKQISDGMWVRDIERGVMDSISPFPWQTDTSIGDWFYSTGQEYKSALEIIQMLVDIVSKNGNLLINIVQTPEGDIEPKVVQTLEALSEWTTINGEGIYATRPWKIYGEGPSTKGAQEKGSFGGLKDVRSYQSSDIRYTVKNGILYAFVLNTPSSGIEMKSLGLENHLAQQIKTVALLGSKEKLHWQQTNSSLSIDQPLQLPKQGVICFKITF